MRHVSQSVQRENPPPATVRPVRPSYVLVVHRPFTGLPRPFSPKMALRGTSIRLPMRLMTCANPTKTQPFEF